MLPFQSGDKIVTPSIPVLYFLRQLHKNGGSVELDDGDYIGNHYNANAVDEAERQKLVRFDGGKEYHCTYIYELTRAGYQAIGETPPKDPAEEAIKHLIMLVGRGLKSISRGLSRILK